MNNPIQIDEAVSAVKQGGIIAYPTESIFGLGCDPFNQTAVNDLLRLKQRPVEKGLILVASHIRQILPYIQPIEANDLARALKTWPGHYTWVFPKTLLVPQWISGSYPSIAVRVSKHPTIVALCQQLNAPLVSTSANKSDQNVLASIKDIKDTFGAKIHAYVDAPLGAENSASRIRDAHTLNQLR